MLDIRNAKASVAITFTLPSSRAMQCPAPDPVTGEYYVSQASGVLVEDSLISRQSATGEPRKLLGTMRLTAAGHPTTISVLRRNGVLGIVCRWNKVGVVWVPWRDGKVAKTDKSIVRLFGSADTAFIDHATNTVCLRFGRSFKLYELVGDKIGKQIGKTIVDVNQVGPSQGYFSFSSGGEYYLMALFGYGHATQKQIADVRSFTTGKPLYTSNVRVLPKTYELQEPESGFASNGNVFIGMSSKTVRGKKTPILVKLTIPAPVPPKPASPPVVTPKTHFPGDAFFSEMSILEGVTNWLYFDTHKPPLATTGIGNMIDAGGKMSAEGLALNWKTKSGKSATDAEINAEYKRLRALGNIGSGFAYERHATLFLDKTDVRKLFDRKTAEFIATLTKYVPTFESLPADAQLALMSMAWNVGPNLVNPDSSGYWPNLTAGLKAQDFWKCADNCEINGHPSVRNRHNRTLFMQAARVKQYKSIDPAKLRGFNVVVDVSSIKESAPDNANIHVWWLQGMLREQGLYKLPVDGMFGPATKKAFETFCTKWKIKNSIDVATVGMLSSKTLQLKVQA